MVLSIWWVMAGLVALAALAAAGALAWLVEKRLARFGEESDQARQRLIAENEERRRRAEAARRENRERERLVEERKRLYQISRNLAAVLKTEQLRREVGRCLSTFFDYERGEIISLARDGEEDRAPAVASIFRLENMEKIAGHEEGSAPLASEGLELALQLGDLRGVHYLAQPEGEGWPPEIKNFCILPIMAGDRPAEVVVLWNLKERHDNQPPPEEEVLARLLALAGQFNLTMQKCHLYDEIEKLSRTDPQLGVYKRWFFLERAAELTRSTSHGRPLSLLLIDIDHFKHYNDTYGYLTGDQVLQHVARFLEAHVRAQDLVGRYGGEEFLVALTDTGREGALAVAERIRGAVAAFRFEVRGQMTGVTVSVGVAVFPEEADNVQELIYKAGDYLYQAKQAGRNRICANLARKA